MDIAHAMTATRALVATHAGLWAATLVGFAIGVAVPDMGRARLSLRLVTAHAATPAYAAKIFLGNLTLVCLPAVLGQTGSQMSTFQRRLGDGFVASMLIVNGLRGGLAIGAYGPAIAPFLPHLPLEWCGLACGCAAWVTGRDDVPWRLCAGAAACLAAAALLEVFAVPGAQP